MKKKLKSPKEIFEALYEESPLLKTELAKKVGLNTDSLSQWIDIIEFIQRQPKLLKKKIGKRIALARPPAFALPNGIEIVDLVGAMIEFEKYLEKVEEVPQKKE